MTATNPPRLWTEPEIETLRVRWAAGDTCRQIAHLLPGRTRMAVAGMAQRLNLPIRGEVQRRKSGRWIMMARRVVARGVVIRDYVPAPITLAGPAWSHPSNARAA